MTILFDHTFVTCILLQTVTACLSCSKQLYTLTKPTYKRFYTEHSDLLHVSLIGLTKGHDAASQNRAMHYVTYISHIKLGEVVHQITLYNAKTFACMLPGLDTVTASCICAKVTSIGSGKTPNDCCYSC